VFTVTLNHIRRLSDSTIELQFQRDDDAGLSFLPGQFYRFVFCDEAGDFERSYSLCNLLQQETQAGCLRLVISEVDGGRATLLLFNAALGLTARVTGPYGRLVLPDVLPQRLFLVATSVGIAPYLPMLEVLAEPLSRGELQVHFMFGVRDPSEFLYASLLMGYAEKYPDFHLAICYSRQMPATPASHDHSGYVQQYLPKPDASTDLYLLCGNPAMVDECFAQLKAGDIGSRQVLREKYVFAKRPKVASSRVLSSDSSGGLNDGPSAEQKHLIAEKMRKYQKD
jgi:benzoate/toluate 1,2-dioxygenase reductase subunit